MNYKNILLALLVIPSSGYATHSLEELKMERHKKELEVRELTQKIARAYTYIQEVFKDYNTFLDNSVDERLKKLDDPVDKEEIRKSILSENKHLYNEIAKSIFGKQPLHRSLFSDLFDDSEPASIMSFQADKFLEISAFLEYAFIRNTVPIYEQRIKELVDINRQICELEQKGNHA